MTVLDWFCELLSHSDPQPLFSKLKWTVMQVCMDKTYMYQTVQLNSSIWFLSSWAKTLLLYLLYVLFCFVVSFYLFWSLMQFCFPSSQSIHGFCVASHRQDADSSLLPQHLWGWSDRPALCVEALQGVVSQHHHQPGLRAGLHGHSAWQAHVPLREYHLVGLVVTASARRAEDLGFESCLEWDFCRVMSYQWLRNWHFSGYPARHLAVYGQCWDWLAQCQSTVIGWDGKFDLKLLSQCVST